MLLGHLEAGLPFFGFVSVYFFFFDDVMFGRGKIDTVRRWISIYRVIYDI